MEPGREPLQQSCLGLRKIKVRKAPVIQPLRLDLRVKPGRKVAFLIGPRSASRK